MKKQIRKNIAMILVLVVSVVSSYFEPVMAGDANANDDIVACVEANLVDIQSGNLNVKQQFADLELPACKDGIMETLAENTEVLTEIKYEGNDFINTSNLYGESYDINAGLCGLQSTIAVEKDLCIHAQNLSTQENGAIIYSKHGNINLTSGLLDYTGILYAPEGSVTVSAENVKFTGMIVAKEVLVYADEAELERSWGDLLQMLGEIRTSSILFSDIENDKDNRRIVFHLEEGKNNSVYFRKAGEKAFDELVSATDEVFYVSYAELGDGGDFRTSAEQYGETKLSTIVSFRYEEGELKELEVDSDNDGIPDGYEIWDAGTDPDMADTDGDGFEDGYEVFMLHTDPLKFDSDADFDNDGISNLDEMRLGTHPYLPDSDFDMINDGDDEMPLVTDVSNDIVVDSAVALPVGLFDVEECWFDESGNKSGVVYNYVNGEGSYRKSASEEVWNYYDTSSNEIANISKIEGAYIVTACSYDEAGNKTSIAHNGMRYDYSYDEDGNLLTAKIGDNYLEKNTYVNGQLAESVYGNGDSERNVYDEEGNLLKSYANGELTYEWEYDAEGNPTVCNDYVSDKSYHYEYDEEGGLKQTVSSDGFSVEYVDTGDGVETVYSDGSEELSKSVKVEDESENHMKLEVSYGEETFAASIEGDTLTTHFVTEEGIVAQAEYNFNDEETVEEETHEGETIEYSYDDNGNIIEVIKNGEIETSYEYDAKGQLIRENSKSGEATITYEYDDVGNILKSEEHELDFDRPTEQLDEGEAAVYSYENAEWTDLLTAYNGNTITYDEMGNPTIYYNGAVMEWNGRSLAGVDLDDCSISYTYDAYGIRNGKTVNGETIEYLLENNCVIAEKHDGGTVWYMYDTDSTASGFRYGDETYFYEKNLLGDVCRIVDRSGECIVEYEYDSSGQLQGMTGDAEIGKLNPFRYRGYYYDEETGFYYLRSRYYDPQTGRFLNADKQSDDGAGYARDNLFAYAGNNGVMKTDPSGEVATVLTWIGAMAIMITIVVICNVFLKTWFRNVDKIVGAVDHELKKLGRCFATLKNTFTAVAKDVGRSFAKVKVQPKYRKTTEKHHIVARGDHRAAYTKSLLRWSGIDPENGKENLINIKTGLHRRLHTNSYYRVTNEVIIKSYNVGKNTEDKKSGIKRALAILKVAVGVLNQAAPF